MARASSDPQDRPVPSNVHIRNAFAYYFVRYLINAIMPATSIDYTAVHSILNKEKVDADASYDNIISTPYGLSILEIQGELNLPKSVPEDDEIASGGDYVSNFATIDSIYHAVKFGRLDFDANDHTKVTLFIGKSQRLLGNLVDLDTPLGVLRITRSYQLAESNRDDNQLKMVDIIRKKIIFKQRPLPIM